MEKKKSDVYCTGSSNQNSKVSSGNSNLISSLKNIITKEEKTILYVVTIKKYYIRSLTP